MEEPTLDWGRRETANCPIGLAVDVLGDRWSLLLLRELAFGVDRFDAVREHLGISRRTLTERLDALVGAGVAERVPYREPGQRTRHRYQLTAAGRDVLPLLIAFGAWGQRYRGEVRSPVRMVHRDCGGTVSPRLQCSAGHDVGDPAQVLPTGRRSRDRESPAATRQSTPAPYQAKS